MRAVPSLRCLCLISAACMGGSPAFPFGQACCCLSPDHPPAQGGFPYLTKKHCQFRACAATARAASDGQPKWHRAEAAVRSLPSSCFALLPGGAEQACAALSGAPSCRTSGKCCGKGVGEREGERANRLLQTDSRLLHNILFSNVFSRNPSPCATGRRLQQGRPFARRRALRPSRTARGTRRPP